MAKGAPSAASYSAMTLPSPKSSKSVKLPKSPKGTPSAADTLGAEVPKQSPSRNVLIPHTPKPKGVLAPAISSNIGALPKHHTPILKAQARQKQLSKPKGGGLSVAAITPSSVVNTAENVGKGIVHGAAAAGKGIVDFGKTTGEGALGIGSAIVSDALHGRLGQYNDDLTGPSQTAQILSKSFKTDPWVQTVEGHPKALLENPVGAALDLGGGYSLIGKGLGAAARTGALGSKLADAADTTRATKVVLPGHETPTGVISHDSAKLGDVQHYSKNLFTAVTQKHLEAEHPEVYRKLQNAGTIAAHPVRTVHDIITNKGDRVPSMQTHELNRAVDELESANRMDSASQIHDVLKTAKEAKPKSKLAADLVGEMLNGLPEEGAHLETALGSRLQELKNAVANDTHAGHATESLLGGDYTDIENNYRHLLDGHPLAGRELDKLLTGAHESPEEVGRAHDILHSTLHGHRMSQPAIDENLKLQQTIKEFLHDPTGLPGQVSEGARANVDLGHQLESQKSALGLAVPEEMERRVLQPHAIRHMGAEVIKPRLSESHYEALDVRNELKEQKKDFADLTKKQGAYREAFRPGALPEEDDLKVAQHKLQVAMNRERRTRYTLTGRHGQSRFQARYSLIGGEKPLTMEGALPRGSIGRAHHDEERVTEAQQSVQTAKDALAAAKSRRRHNYKLLKSQKQDELNTTKQTYGIVRGNVGHTMKGLAIPDKSLRSGYRVPTNTDIRANMEEHGISPETTGYLHMGPPHDNSLGSAISRAFGSRSSTRGGAKGSAYTGRGLESGAYNTGYRGVVLTHLKSVREIQRAMAHDRRVKMFGLQKPSGEYYNSSLPKEIEDAQTAYRNKHGIDLEPHYARPQALSSEQRNIIADIHNPDRQGAKEDQFSRENSAVDLKNPKPNERVVMMPKTVLDRTAEHQQPLNGLQAMGANVSNAFRRAVLPLSKKWYLSLLGEGALRGTLAGVNPLAYRLAPRVIDRMRELGFHDEADHLEAITSTGTHFGMQLRDLHTELASETKADAGRVHSLARGVLDGYVKVTNKMLQAGRKLEQQQTRATLGRHMQLSTSDEHATSAFVTSMGKSAQMQQDYIDHLAHAYSDPAMARDASRYINEVLGQYNHFSPAEQRFIRTVAPFWPWYRNAVHFVYTTMPREHPLLQAVLYNAGIANQRSWDQAHAGAMATFTDFMGSKFGTLESALKTGPSSYVDAARFTPYGIGSETPPNELFNVLFPQFSGAYQQLTGNTVFGSHDYSIPQSFSGSATAKSLEQLGSSFAPVTPLLGALKASHGGSKSQPSHGVAGVADKLLNPLQPTHYGVTGGTAKLPARFKNLPAPVVGSNSGGVVTGHNLPGVVVGSKLGR